MRPALALLLASGSALAVSQDREVAAFHAVHVASGIHADVTVGARKPVHLEGEAEVLERIEVRVEDGELMVGYKRGTNFFNHESDVRVTIQTPELTAVGGSGGSIVRAQLTRGTEQRLDASGGSELHVTGADAAHLKVHGSGGAVIEVTGTADALELELSGGSRLRGKHLEVRDVEVDGSGGATASLRASGKIRGALSGGSEVHVHGGASSSHVSTSGGSSVDFDD